MRKKILFVVIIVQVVIMVSLVRGIMTTLRSQKRVDQLASKRDGLERTKKELEDKLEATKSDYYVEKIAREQLNLVKEGEIVILLPDYQEQSKPEDKPKEEKVSSWREWWDKLTKGQ